MSFTTPRFAVLLTCYNRKKNTLKCLTSLYEQNINLMSMHVFLVDDGSTDGTAAEVREKFPKVNIIHGNGSLFWNRGMHLAFSRSLKIEFDFYLWLNDDTHLYPKALSNLFNLYYRQNHIGENPIIVGSTLDPYTKKISYGGYKRDSSWHPFKYQLINPNHKLPVSCDTMCGNCVLIPKQVVDIVGNINPTYRHRWGDVDYGLRAKRAGCKIYTAPGFIGECSFNMHSNTWEDKKLTFKQRLHAINSIKGLQKEDWKYYTRRYGGFFWFLFWLSPYVKIFFSSFSLKNLLKLKLCFQN